MASISYDGQSFMIDGRRIWLVSGSIHYPRVPRGLWRDRIRAAKQAGLNCIDTPVFWNVHEPRPNALTFEDQADLRHFVELIAAEKMYCILRPGPYINADCDHGGLPAWLDTLDGIKLRENNGPFLEAAARYLRAVMQQVRDLQASEPTNGPIILMQSEHQWFTHHPGQEEDYLTQLVRFYRENGCTVPITQCNNLWNRTEGALDTWTAGDHLASDLRQLRLVQPNAPRMVSGLQLTTADTWGREPRLPIDADTLSEKLAQVLSAGAQYNLDPFHGGSNFDLLAGRTIDDAASFTTTTHHAAAPLGEGGHRGDAYHAVKRISTFASQFGHVFAHLADETPHATIATEPADHLPSVIHQPGAQGDVIWIIRSGKPKPGKIDVLLPNGLTLPVFMGKDRVAWMLTDTDLNGAGKLSYTNLRPWAMIDRRMLVLFGPADTDGLIAINQSPLTVKVPTGKTPLVTRLHDITLVILNEDQLDAAYPAPGKLIVGTQGLDEQDQPQRHARWSTITTLDAAGEKTTSKPPRNKRLVSPRLTDWQQAPLEDMLTGQSDALAVIDGPASLEKLAPGQAYGWYRLNLQSSGNSKVLSPRSGDRLHLFAKGKRTALLGVCLGAEDQPSTIKASGSVVVLADQLGHFSRGWRLGETTGLVDHFYKVKQVKLAKPKTTQAVSPDPSPISGALEHLSYPERHSATRLDWTISPSGRKPVVLDIVDLPMAATISLNDEMVGVYDPQLSAGRLRLCWQVGEPLKGGRNTLSLSLFEPLDPKVDPRDFISVYQCTASLSARGQWAFAPLTRPDSQAFTGTTKSDGNPCWYRATFSVNHYEAPLWLETNGLSKGMLYVNGRCAGRFFHSSPTGKTLGTQHRYYLPEPWLTLDKDNELVIFDEHGKAPSQCRLVYHHTGNAG